MTLIWVAGIILIGEGFIALIIRRAVRTFGVYGERLQKTHDQNLEIHDQNIEIRKNIAVQRNEEAIEHIIDNPTEREA